MQRIPVGRWEDLACGMRRVVRVPGRVDEDGRAYNVVVVIERDGAFALHDSCPHYGVALSTGTLSNGFLECPWHNWRIDVRTGSCLHSPRTRADTFATEYVDGILYVCVPDDSPIDAIS